MTATPAQAALQRTRGALRLRFDRADDAATRLGDLYQDGALRARLPRGRRAAEPEAVVINTAGGLTGGDHLEIEVTCAEQTRAWVTSQACEKIYRSAGGAVHLHTRLRVEAGAELFWAPQPAILFDQGRFHRHLEVDVGAGGRALVLEAAILGRHAMGERFRHGLLADHWRIRQQGRLAFASEFRLEADGADGALTHPAALADAAAMATLLWIGEDAAERLEPIRALLDRCSGLAGASRRKALVHAQLLAPDASTLMDDLRRIVEGVSGRAMPRVWSC